MNVDETTEFTETVDRYLRSSGGLKQYRETAETVLRQFESWLRRQTLNG
ncbi:hypothetical protein [Halopelagius longus]|nr:hypothetical protein [Halopelagius longus]